MNQYPVGMLTPVEAVPFVRAAFGKAPLLESVPDAWFSIYGAEPSCTRLQVEYLMDTLRYGGGYGYDAEAYGYDEREEHSMMRCHVVVVNALPTTLRLKGRAKGERFKHGEERGVPCDSVGGSFPGLPPATEGHPSFAIWHAAKTGPFHGMKFALSFESRPEFPSGLSIAVDTPHSGKMSRICVDTTPNYDDVLPGKPANDNRFGSQVVKEWTGEVRGEKKSYLFPAAYYHSKQSYSFIVVAALLEQGSPLSLQKD